MSALACSRLLPTVSRLHLLVYTRHAAYIASGATRAPPAEPDARTKIKRGKVKTAYLDIETNYVGRFTDQRLFKDYKNHKITVIGIRLLSGTDESFLQMVGEDISKDKLMKSLEGVTRLVTYNGRSKPDKVKGYTGFDFPVIAAQLGVMLDEELDHTDLCPKCWQAGFWGGQKKVEQALGLERNLPGKDGAWADEAWKKYKASGDQRFLNELLAYNKEDVFMLRRIEEALAQV